MYSNIIAKLIKIVQKTIPKDIKIVVMTLTLVLFNISTSNNLSMLCQPFSISTMHQEKYSLTWHTYSEHLKSMMKELMMNEDFSDVTLVTEDKKHIKANTNILSTCSPVFKGILKKEKNFYNPIVYLRGIQFSEMESILQFIYLGEATFYKERMVEFLAVAKCYIREVFIHH